MSYYDTYINHIMSLVLSGVAFLMLLLAKKDLFISPPIPRYSPLNPHNRSTVNFLLITISPWLLLIGVTLFSPSEITNDYLLTLSLIMSALYLMSLIITLYWIYRIHGEMAWLYYTPKLLTPRAAVLISFLLPLGIPLILLCLASVVKEADFKLTGKIRSFKWYNLWAIIFPPISISMYQSILNELNNNHVNVDKLK